jgi:hypothetical protein
MYIVRGTRENRKGYTGYIGSTDRREAEALFNQMVEYHKDNKPGFRCHYQLLECAVLAESD